MLFASAIFFNSPYAKRLAGLKPKIGNLTSVPKNLPVFLANSDIAVVSTTSPRLVLYTPLTILLAIPPLKGSSIIL